MAAADRCKGMEPFVWVDVENASPECIEDVFKLGRAMLPLLDPTPLDENWLRGAGFRRGLSEPMAYTWLLAKQTFAIYVQVDGMYCIQLLPVETRGQVRMACLSAGIELKESK